MNELNEEEQSALLGLARLAIVQGLNTQKQLVVTESDYPERLRQTQASFVTLEKKGLLRGCIGSLEAHQSLCQDVAHNAFMAAFSDPRFPSLKEAEYSDVSVSISVLSIPQPMSVHSESDLLNQLRPGVDGLILFDQYHRGTFLPSVWEQLPTPEEFLAHLKVKAGLTEDYWSDELSFSNYTTQYIQESS